MKRRTWPDLSRQERIDLIKAGIAEGMSSGQIASWIGGCTRNAVIGMAYRAKIALYVQAPAKTPAKTPKKEVKRAPREILKRERRLREAVVPDKPDEFYHVNLMDVREGQCRWPLWGPERHPERYTYCGKPTRIGAPYCPKCCELATPKPRKEQDDGPPIKMTRPKKSVWAVRG